MSDEDAYCPLCKNEFTTVKDVCYHINQTAGLHKGYYVRRTKTCEECEKEFVPKNWCGPNKYCSESCAGTEPLGIVTKSCKNCGDSFELKKSHDKHVNQRFCSRSCGVSGEFNWRWAGGSDDIRHSPEYKSWRKEVHQKRDDCAECGSTEMLQAHHIVPVSEDKSLATDIDNGTLLCWECHSSKHPTISEKLFMY